MYSKSLLIYLVVCFLSDLSHGQGNNNLIWRDYNYIEEVKGFYKIHTTPQTWSKAKKVCAQEGASLFYAENDKEAHAVVSFWKRTQPDIGEMHVGISDLKVKTQFETIDGKLASEVYNNWMTGEPSNKDDRPEHCVNMYRDETMNNIPCSLACEFVCKKSLQSVHAEISKCSMSVRDGQRNENLTWKDYNYIDIKGFYKIHTTPETWYKAKQVCAEEGASLFYPENDNEAHAVKSFWIRTQPSIEEIYLGMSDITDKTRFQTIDGKPASEVYNNWLPGEPNNWKDKENCVVMYKHGWNDARCDEPKPFLCKKILQSVECNCSMSNLDGQNNNQFYRKDYNHIEEVKGFYKIHTIPQSWFDAKRLCALEGASLFYPENDTESQAVISFWNRTQPTIEVIFVGMSDLLGQFETIDRKTISEVYNNWKPGQPDNYGGKEKCVRLSNDGYIDDCSCDYKAKFICKKSQHSLGWNYNCSMSNLDYIFNEDSGNCYKLHTTPLTWTEAYAACSAEQSYLAVINNQLEADYLAGLTQSAPTPSVRGYYLRGLYHLGFHNRFSEGWQTVKGTPLNADADAWWNHYQPVGNEQCGSMFFNGRLNNVECDTRIFFICEHEVDSLNLPEEGRQ